ncbi:MAG: GTP-binding protein [Promethearchaeota archaeon]
MGLFKKKREKPEKIFKINDLVDLRLINNDTLIYVNDKPFIICAHLLINIPVDRIHRYDKVKSIDETVKLLRTTEQIQYRISPEEEFMGHCSNIQAFFESGLNTDILHTNIAFPLLRKLVELKFEPAQRVFKEEIAIRFNEGTYNSRLFLYSGGYLDYLNEEEKHALKDYLNFVKFEKPIWLKVTFLYKIVILGDVNVGRSTLGINYLNSRKNGELINTIGINIATKEIVLDNHGIRLQIWFLSNLKNFKRFWKYYLSGTFGAIIMYDITNINSMDYIPKWIQTIRENRWNQSRGDIPILLVGNKADLEEKRVVSKEEGIKIKNRHNLTGFMEISLRTGKNVAEMFDEITRLINRSVKNTNEL